LNTGGTFVTAGWWTNIELGSPDEDDPADVGLGRAWFGENDLWLEVSSMIGPVGLSGGLIRYLFAREDAFPDARLFDTSDLYGRVWVNAGAFVPEVSVWYDVDKVDGAYVDTGLDYRVPTLPSRSPILSLYLVRACGLEPRTGGESGATESGYQSAGVLRRRRTHTRRFGLQADGGRGVQLCDGGGTCAAGGRLAGGLPRLGRGD
jgi:hypothetical protein